MNIKENAVIAFTFTETDPKDYQYFYNKLKDLSKEENVVYPKKNNEIPDSTCFVRNLKPEYHTSESIKKFLDDITKFNTEDIKSPHITIYKLLICLTEEEPLYESYP
ncbi:MAG: hypothetical protein IPH52_04225 [Leptospiraceae bacterium]|nr:hypothetical protein [Leptospiraceae bacterium]